MTDDDGIDPPAPDDDGPKYVEVPLDKLAPETLDRLLSEVALRDDTDYGDHPVPIERRVELARKALARGDLVVVFDLGSETATVLPAKEFRRLQG